MTKTLANLKKKNRILWKKNNLYKSPWINKLINRFIIDGKRHQAESLIYEFLIEMKLVHDADTLMLYFVFLEEIKPLFTLIPKRIGKHIRLIPFPMGRLHRYKKAIAWLHKSIESRTEWKVLDRIINEFLDFETKNRSQALTYKDEIKKSTIANRAYLHYRWG